ncbi:hypothetical protein JCM10212_006831 [Sporobolomyces blumeae]
MRPLRHPCGREDDDDEAVSVPRTSVGSRSSWEDDDELAAHSPLLPVARPPDAHKEHGATPGRADERIGSEGGQAKRRRKHVSISVHRRQHRLAALCRVATAFVLALALLVGTATCVWASTLIYTRHNAYARSVFARPLEPRPKPVEPLVAPFPLSSRPAPVPALEPVQSLLDERLASLNLVRSTLDCDDLASPALDGNSTAAARYSTLPHSGPYLFALNLYNSQDVLPTLVKTLLTVSDFLGRDNVHVSVFENGSSDNTTLALAHFAAALTTLGVPHTIVSDSQATDWSRVDRIEQLAIYRNVALAPVVQGAPDGRPFETVVFVNDVFAGPVDVLELVYQRKEQEADAACAMDWRGTKGILSKVGAGSVKMYDNWVSRSIRGNMLRARLDVWSEARHGVDELFQGEGDEPSRDRFLHGLPVPVYSCWNGMLALNAEPFLSTQVNPRSSRQEGPHDAEGGKRVHSSSTAARFRSALRSEGQCAASECKTLARDFWSRGYNRWIIVPTVHVTYSQEIYTHPHLVEIVDRARSFLASTGSFSDPALRHLTPRINWTLPEWTAPQSVVCWSWVRGFHIDLPGWRSTRESAWRR